jgi:hypothetical protein
LQIRDAQLDSIREPESAILVHFLLPSIFMLHFGSYLYPSERQINPTTGCGEKTGTGVFFIKDQQAVVEV